MEWRPIPNYPNYNINALGQIKSNRKILNPTVTHDGYLRVGIYNGKKSMLNNRSISGQFFVHRIVAALFVPNPSGHPDVNHLNGIKTDNRAENLEWVTKKENCLHAFRLGLSPIGERSCKAKLKEHEAREILLSNEIGVDLAKKYNVHPSTIYNIRNRKKWKHIAA